MEELVNKEKSTCQSRELPHIEVHAQMLMMATLIVIIIIASIGEDLYRPALF